MSESNFYCGTPFIVLNYAYVFAELKDGLAFLKGKVMNCGGGGSCGTCIVEVQ